jgi:hypothetical protein
MKYLKKYTDIENSQVIELFKSLFVPISSNLSYTFIGWQDGDYFKEICQEDGGTIEQHLKRFNNMFIIFKIIDLNKLLAAVHDFQQFPCLTSVGENYKYHYDMHIWSDNYYVVYNSFLKMLLLKKRNIINRVFSPIIIPDWQKIEL